LGAKHMFKFVESEGHGTATGHPVTDQKQNIPRPGASTIPGAVRGAIWARLTLASPPQQTSIQFRGRRAAVKKPQQWPAFQMLYAAWPKEVVVANPTEVDPQHRRPRSGALEDKELEAYVTIFTALLEAERGAGMDEEALEARVGAGHNGFRIKVGDHVILSRVHPYQYAFKHPLLVCAVEERALQLDAKKYAPEDAAEGEWQVDRHVNANNFYRMAECLERFVRRDGCPLVQLVAKEPGTPDIRGRGDHRPAGTHGPHRLRT